MSDIQNSIYVSGSHLQYWYRFSWVCWLRAWSLSNGKRLGLPCDRLLTVCRLLSLAQT
jgi:hypothetical protein